MNTIQSIHHQSRIHRRPPRRRRAFTVVELMVVISVIIILVALLFLGVNQITGSARVRDTKTVLQAATAMMGTYEQTTHLTRVPGGITNFWTTNFVLDPPNPTAPYSPGTNTASFDASFFLLDEASATSPKTIPTSNAAAYKAVAQTVQVMNMLRQIPENQTIINNLPPARVKMLTIYYPSSAAGAITGPVLLDGWGHPVIFVPSGGLTNVTYSGQVNASGAPLLYFVTSTGKYQSAAAAANPINRAFFMSAGPDGDLGLGDDNVYSFEN